ncbi:ATP synthase subunit gamma, mitochondrial [Lepeophtheirus salmonis]|uniref:ATP synthase subunit gamma n=1 Tax=Lepeophtheirus salmonis TaxID=72036 RepID=C1BTJ1_LEPSM|nr:ATP synthase subunit gamma, mitochondrial-like [Lepeophtheirus salmonis]ACO12344.1 ATP synthase subunit gamma, mitochondrial precursor [Lepeophtheirus salmonis]ADD24304.1 ATP synthase subunit gamma, mitochondrial [Lepeophtheirus salmonis]
MLGTRAVVLGSKTCLYQQERGMANLKAIAMRLKSVKNIQKITQSMKMVSAAKYARAERDLKAARPYGNGSKAFYEKTEVDSKEEAPKELIVALTSDRGLCGAVHSSICKNIRYDLLERENIDNVGIICVGDKSRAQLQRFFAKNILMVGSEIGRLPPQFGDASKIASNIMQSGFEYDVGRLMYNKFKSVVSYKTTTLNIFSKDSVAQAEKLSVYDSIDDDVLQSYLEYNLASLIYYCLKEGACSEQSSRMTAMDNSSKNAGEMIDKLTLTYNRTRQAVITGELIEIISGAAAL